MEYNDNTLPEHEAHSEARGADTAGKVGKREEANEMGQPVNVFTTPNDGCCNRGGYGNGGYDSGAGAGAGLLGGMLGSMVFGNRGGHDNHGGYSAMDSSGHMAILGAVGSVKDTVSAGTASVVGTVNMGNMSLLGTINTGFATQATNTLQQTLTLMQQANGNQAMLMSELCGVNQNVSAQGCMTREAVSNDGEKTRGLIVQLNTDNLNRLLTVADLDRRDECNRANLRGVEVNVAQTVNQVQLQAQQQQQQQQTTQLLTHLCSVVGTLQNAVATNSNLIVGNTGATTTGAQTANPVNVKG